MAEDNYKLISIDQTAESRSGICNVLMNTRFFTKSKSGDYSELYGHVINVISLALISSQANGHNTFLMTVDMTDTLYKNVDAAFFKNIVKLMLDMFPDRLERCDIYNSPSYFPMVFSLIKGVIPKSTRHKIVIHRGACEITADDIEGD